MRRCTNRIAARAYAATLRPSNRSTPTTAASADATGMNVSGPKYTRVTPLRLSLRHTGKAHTAGGNLTGMDASRMSGTCGVLHRRRQMSSQALTNQHPRRRVELQSPICPPGLRPRTVLQRDTLSDSWVPYTRKAKHFPWSLPARDPLIPSSHA